jgi:hypothetical protein
MPTPMMNASELAAPSRVHQRKGTELFWSSLLMATTAKFLQICLSAKHLSKYVTRKL